MYTFDKNKMVLPDQMEFKFKFYSLFYTFQSHKLLFSIMTIIASIDDLVKETVDPFQRN